MTNEIVLNGKTYVEKTQASYSEYFIFRCKDAGVHAGKCIQNLDVQSPFVVITDSRRLWSWISKATLSELAETGPVNPKENKYGAVVPRMRLRMSDICEVIPCSEAAAKAINNVPVWSANG